VSGHKKPDEMSKKQVLAHARNIDVPSAGFSPSVTALAQKYKLAIELLASAPNPALFLTPNTPAVFQLQRFQVAYEDWRERVSEIL